MGVTGAVAGLVELKVSPGCETQTIPTEPADGEATEEPPDSGETDGGMSDRGRSFAVPSVDPTDCLSARRPIAGTAERLLVRLAFFWAGPGPGKNTVALSE
jgi:hypothetical protein